MDSIDYQYAIVVELDDLNEIRLIVARPFTSRKSLRQQTTNIFNKKIF